MRRWALRRLLRKLRLEYRLPDNSTIPSDVPCWLLRAYHHFNQFDLRKPEIGLTAILVMLVHRQLRAGHVTADAPQAPLGPTIESPLAAR